MVRDDVQEEIGMRGLNQPQKKVLIRKTIMLYIICYTMAMKLNNAYNISKHTYVRTHTIFHTQNYFN